MSRKPWPGGYIHKQKDGRKLFIIERKIRNKRFHVSTRAHDWDAAMVQLAKFEAAPDQYDPAVSLADGVPVYLTNERILDYFDFSVLPQEQGGSGNTRKHANEKTNRLKEWKKDLGGKDLRHLDLIADLKAALDKRRTCRSHRIIAIKSFFTWLRREKGLIKHAEDATLNLGVPQAVPEKRKRKKALPWPLVEAVMGKLNQRDLDVLTLRIATGMHQTELERFVRGADSQLVDAPAGADYLAVMSFLHKNRNYTPVPLVHPEQLAAARRLREARTVPSRLNKRLKEACAAIDDKLKKACAAAGVDPTFTYGQLRHSVATWALEDGVVPAKVSQFIGHLDPRTTRRFYADLNVPAVVIPTRRLELVKSGT